MSTQPPPPTGAPRAYEQPRVMAPTLIDFWRSDVRRPPGRKAPRWAGWLAFVLGLLSILGLLLGAGTSSGLVIDLAIVLSWAAGFFGLVAVIAGIGRGLGFVGLIFVTVTNLIGLWGLGRILGLG